MQTTITTKRLILRPFDESDARRIAYLAGDYAVSKMCSRIPHPYTMAHAYEFIGMTARGRESASEFSFAVTAPLDGLIGACGVARAGDNDAFELGYWFGAPYWGMGYASEAARAVMDWAREQLGVESFTSGHFTDNPASGHVLRKLGFTPSGAQELFGLARQRSSPAARYVWPAGATPANLQDSHAPRAH